MDNYKEYLDPKDGYALVKSSIDMPVHPTWIEIPVGATTAIYYLPTKKVYFWKGEDVHWNTDEWMDCKAAELTTVTEFLERNESRIVWKRSTQDPALISGAEALRALADGKEVDVHESTYKNEVWFNLKDTKFTPAEILAEKVRNKPYTLTFRLKPQTIKVELELPKPFEPKDGDIYWFITCRTEKGYSCRNHKARHGDSGMQFGAFRTEDEIKQVVEQLRKIRGAS
ncbi:hypothetical protein SJZ78_03035 [Acinetobacter baumannii]|nr:hypothetical protein [Acinetobacter baumannii]MDX7905394.1 hypothetical protein [Acinetobacter baumannii]MDX7925139.1 hypothetical protein [Acinetobacter baumannii]